MTRHGIWIIVALAAAVFSSAALAQQPGFRERDPRVNPGRDPLLDRLMPGVIPQPLLPRRWRLGVNVRDTDVGVLLVEIFPGTAAARAGMEVGDVVVSVNGYQVGNVLGQTFDIADEFERRADAQGRVRFLILDARTGELVNRDINLDSRGNTPVPVPNPNPQPQVVTVTGKVAWRERVILPPNGTVEVQLIDVSQAGRAEIIGEQQIRGPAQSPFPFTLRADPARVQAQGRYVVQSRVYIDRTVQWSSSAPVAVLTRGNPQQDITVVVEPVR